MFHQIAETPIGDVNSRQPVRVKTRTPVLSVVQAMAEGGRGAAIVEDKSGKVLGIFTERDVIARIDHSSPAWQDISVDDVMIRNPKTIEESHYLREALAIMIEGKFRHLPIVDTEDHVLGIVSIRDILVHVADLFPEEFLNLPPGPEHEATDQWGG